MIPLALVLVLALQTPTPPPSTASWIRTECGLPAESAEGDIRLLDVGHHVQDTMISIVARRAAGGWRISFVCGQSPMCGRDAQGRWCRVLDYAPSPPHAATLDRLLAADLAPAPSRPAGGPPLLCGRQTLQVGRTTRATPGCVHDGDIEAAQEALAPPPERPPSAF